LEALLCPWFGGAAWLDSSCHGEDVLELYWGQHAKAAVAPLSVVEDLQVLEDRVGQLHAGPSQHNLARALRQVIAGYGFAVFELAGRDEAQVCVQGPSAAVLRVVARGFAMPRQSGPFQQPRTAARPYPRR
jgi:hypothetical protein